MTKPEQLVSSTTGGALPERPLEGALATAKVVIPTENGRVALPYISSTPPAWLSTEALLAAALSAPEVTKAIAGLSNAATRGESSAVLIDKIRRITNPAVLRDAYGDRLALHDPALQASVLSDIATAADVILKHDPSPGSLESHFYAEETSNPILGDPQLHELWRKRFLHTTGRTANPYPYEQRRSRLVLPSESTMLHSATMRDQMVLKSGGPWREREPDKFWMGNADPSPGPYSLRKVIEYAVVRDAGPSLPVAAAMMANGTACCGFQQDRINPAAGEFYRSPTFVASIGGLDPGVYGETELGTVPFKITISNRNVDDRSLISFVHETLHGYDELHKLGINHDQLHSLSVFLTQETIPGYLELRRKLNQYTNV